MTREEVLKLDDLARYELFRGDPWAFLTHCVFTHDEVDQDNPIKPFPVHLDYLRFLVVMWMRKKKLAIPKSRRLTVSWTFIALGLWDSIFHKGRSWAFVSKKEEDSKELVQRAKFIYDNIPPEMIAPALLPKLKRGEMQASPPVMEFAEIHSKIMGFPSGQNQLRQRGFSGLFFDEVAFWEEAEAAYASAEPTVKGGGRMVMVSTRFPGFFKKIVYDKLNEKDLNFPEVPPVVPKSPMEGIDVWENPGNGFTIIDLSHRANPAKRDPVFEAELRKSLPLHLFNMEYGKSWASFEGRAVFEDFNSGIHLTQREPDMYSTLPFLLGIDSSGLTPALILGQLQEEKLVVVLELIGSGMGATRFIPWALQTLRLKYPQLTDVSKQCITFFDPAGFKKNEITEQTYLQVMQAHGLTQIRPGPMTWEKRREAVTKRLVGLANKQPKIEIYEKGCPILTAGFKGGYRYADNVANVEPNKVRPIKDIHSHPMDGLEYLCGGLESYRKDYGYDKIPTPSYGFQKTTNDDKPRLRKRYGE